MLLLSARLTRTLALLLSVPVALAGCGAGVAGPRVPADHPCPTIAVPPKIARLWEANRKNGDPVPLTLLIPFADGMPIDVSQGENQPPTLTGLDKWAWDFDAPIGTPVLAAAPGYVVWVRDDSERHGTTRRYADDANWIVLDHGGGLFTSYVHLAKGSAKVKAGQWVEAGTPLGTIGLSGQLTGPHLHFQVENTWGESLPARFVGRSAPFQCSRDPRTNDQVYRPRGQSGLLVGRHKASEMPSGTFAAFGVADVTGLPARILHRSIRYGISGHVTAGMKHVYLLIMPETGGKAIFSESISVLAGDYFSAALRLPNAAQLPAGRYTWALAASRATHVEVDRTVRVSLVNE